MHLDPLSLFFSFVFGALVGSFLNVCAHRLPREESIVRPRSRCPNCGTPIKWYDNIPLLSYLLLRGRCRHCKAPISKRYLFLELFSALFSLVLNIRFGWSVSYLLFFSFVAALLLVSAIDFAHQIIPDEISLPGILVGLVFSFWNPLVSPKEAFLGALCGAGSLYLIGEFYFFLTKREGLGGGDLKLLAFIGAFLGLQSLLPVIFWASLVGALSGITLAVWQKAEKKRTFALPFGPFLSLGALIYLFFPEKANQFLSLWLP